MNLEHPQAADAILDFVTDGVFAVDDDLRITYFNQAAEEILGFRQDDVFGRPCREVFRSSVCQDGCALKSAMKEGRSVMMRATYVTSSAGDRLPVSVWAAALRDERGEMVGSVETFRDLSRIEMSLVGDSRSSLPNVIGQSQAMSRVFEVVPTVAASDSSVLIEGEGGTGKHLIARVVHELSPRRDRPLIVVHCGAVPDRLLECELFGQKTGSPAESRLDKPGRFELADNGTIFLAEICDVSPAIQARLLQVLQTRVIRPAGGTGPRRVDVRVISATNKNVDQMADSGLFRADLLACISEARVSIPPLRERRDDIPLLVGALIANANEAGRAIDGVAPEVMDILMSHSFPGNVRELKNILDYSAVLCPTGVITPEHLPEELTGSVSESPERPDAVEALQRSLIIAALKRHGGNRRAAAEELSVHPTTLWRRARKLGIDLPDVDGRSKPRRH
jgi:PAS domain S-box-containing protein